MIGRLAGVAVSSTSVQLCGRNPNRKSVTFSVGDATNVASVMLSDDRDAVASLGFPLFCGQGPLTLSGQIATHAFFAICLKATDCVVGVIEEFPETPDIPVVFEEVGS